MVVRPEPRGTVPAERAQAQGGAFHAVREDAEMPHAGRLGPHPYLEVVLAVPGDLLETQPLVQGVSAPIDDEHVEEHRLVPARGFVAEPLDELATDPPPLVVRKDLDAPKVDFGRSAVHGN